MHFKTEKIAPEMAEKYLATNYEKQRFVKKPRVQQLVEMMESGEFNGMNGETIKFAKINGKWVLVDGQHRLLAIIQTGKPQEIVVCRGVTEDAFLTMDQGDNRTVSSFYEIAGTPYPKLCAQVAKWLYYEEHSGHPLRWRKSKGALPIPGHISRWAQETYPDMPETLGRVAEYLNGFAKKGMGTKAHLAYCYFRWQLVDPLDAFEVCRFMGTGETAPCRTIHSCREYLLEQGAADTAHGIPGSKRGAKVINALNQSWNESRSGNRNRKSIARLVSPFQKQLDAVKQGSDLTPALVVVG